VLCRRVGLFESVAFATFLSLFFVFIFEGLRACYTRSLLNNMLYILLFMDYLCRRIFL